MYDWLGAALEGSGHVVTANRRLARIVGTEYGERQVESGKLAWPRPAVYSWRDWLAELLGRSDDPRDLPASINLHQSRVLWERCLRRQIKDPLLNVPLLVRQARESWARLHEFGVTLDECRRNATGRDQRLFVDAASDYESILERERWIDDSLLPGLVAKRMSSGAIAAPARVTLAGFDRINPEQSRLLEVLEEAGCVIEHVAGETRGKCALQVFENQDAELRSAGRWARDRLLESPGLRVAIVVTNLERDADRCLRLVREGFSPGWQYAGTRYEQAVNVSYGRPLSAYPGCELALLVLRWLTSELTSADVSLLLRSPMLGAGETGARSRLELHLRRIPDRRWTPAMVLSELETRTDAKDAQDWLGRVLRLDKLRGRLPRRSSPAAWGQLFDDALGLFGWPGEVTLNSAEFQLVNRWRELLNDLARLELVSESFTAGEALSRLSGMASETVFQPEADAGLVEVMGPLEAAGMEFDRLWISGLGSAEWPPQARPSALLARDLQRQHQMPDAEPADTLEYAHRVLSRLVCSAPDCVCSYARSIDDSEQTATSMLADYGPRTGAGTEDPGWHAAALVGRSTAAVYPRDPVPPLHPDEIVAGGAAVLQRQLEEPFSAFAAGRLGINLLQPITFGLSPSVRGSLIHDALYRLYKDLPSQALIREAGAAGLQAAINEAAELTLRAAHRNADPVLAALLRLEERRIMRLLAAVLELDRHRDPFRVSGVERSVSVTIEGVPLHLRVDRIDTLANGEDVILDYKTGMHRKFLGSDGRPSDYQLVVYACAIGQKISDLGLINVDSRRVDVSGAGKTLTPELNWDDALSDWQEQLERVAREFRAGDVRVVSLHSVQSSRPLALLSRVNELRHDA